MHDPLSDPAPFRLLSDDGQRFYADPFPFAQNGRTWLFVEELPFATWKGLLSVAEVAADGTIGPIRPFLEQDCHLSYPNVFAADGEVWMIPETSGRRTIELWRCLRLPDRWERHAVLIEGVDAGDATVAEIDGTWWLFAATRERWTSSWDSVQLWSAPALNGPWRPADLGPARVDVSSARPAGQMLRIDGHWVRPAQDSSQLYGQGLTLNRINRLDSTGLSESVISRLPLPAGVLGLHTWNQTEVGGRVFEVMDIFADQRIPELMTLPARQS